MATTVGTAIGRSEDPISRYFVRPMIDLFLADTPARRRSAALYAQLRDAISRRASRGGRPPPDQPRARRRTVPLALDGHHRVRPPGRRGLRRGRVRGDGTFVADALDAGGGAAANAAPPQRSPRRPSATVAPMSPPPGGWAADLRTGRPDPALFPVVEWRRSVLAALQTAPPGYGERPGLPTLRRAIASWVGRSPRRGRVARRRDRHLRVARCVRPVRPRPARHGAASSPSRTRGTPTPATRSPGAGPAWCRFAVDDEGLVVDDSPTRPGWST